MMSRTSHVFGAAVVSAAAAALITHSLHVVNGLPDVKMPDSEMTPGAVLSVTKEELCVKGYAGKTRNVPESVKRQVYKQYNITKRKPGEYEIDHLISLELGGSNDIKNLWPQSYNGPWNAHMKDKLENKLHELVCKGEITLEEAQNEISTDWVEAYQKYISN